MKQRNPEATCATCPYIVTWQYTDGSYARRGSCIRFPPVKEKEMDDLGGENPDF